MVRVSKLKHLIKVRAKIVLKTRPTLILGLGWDALPTHPPPRPPHPNLLPNYIKHLGGIGRNSCAAKYLQCMQWTGEVTLNRYTIAIV